MKNSLKNAIITNKMLEKVEKMFLSRGITYFSGRYTLPMAFLPDGRKKILKTLYRLNPFDIRGDCQVPPARDGIKISCIINFYGRLDLLSGILFSLAAQNFHRALFEVVLVEDRGGTDAGRKMAEEFEKMLPIVYSPLDKGYGLMGYSRNYGISLSRGEYILFLDDDTVILQDDFLSKLIEEFEASDAEAIIPFGSASYFMLKGRYGYHEPYFPTSRCMAYRRDVLLELSGFVSDIIGQEDVEFSIRFIAAGKKYAKSEMVRYCHPPLFMKSADKAGAVGFSFANLKSRYPFLIYLMLLFNGLRYLPLVFFPITMKWKMQARFSAGFLKGILFFLKGKKIYYQDSV